MREVTKNGQKFLVNDPPSYPEFWTLVENGKWEPDTFDIFDWYLKHNTTYVDIGAWIGPTLMYASRLVTDGECYGFEPDPAAHRMLQAHLELNKVRCTVANLAVNSYDGDVRMGSEMLGNSETRMGFSPNSFGVSCQTLSTLARRFSWRDPLFIKMDVEGGEEEILSSSLDFFARKLPTLYVSLHPWLFKDPDRMGRTINSLTEMYSEGRTFVYPSAFLFVGAQ